MENFYVAFVNLLVKNIKLLYIINFVYVDEFNHVGYDILDNLHSFKMEIVGLA